MTTKKDNVILFETLAKPVSSQERMLEDFNLLLEAAANGSLKNFVGTGFLDDGRRVVCLSGDLSKMVEIRGAIRWLEDDYVVGMADMGHISEGDEEPT